MKPSMRDIVGTWWPIVLPLLAVAGSTVRAEAQNSYQSEQIAEFQRNGSPGVRERLASIEATQEAMKGQLNRIEKKLDAE